VPTQIITDSGKVGCAVRAERGEEPAIEIVIVVGREAMGVSLNAHQAEALGEAILKDARHARGFDPSTG
jgi:hypothetical protein